MNFSCRLSEIDRAKIKHFFETMEISNVEVSDAPFIDWLKKHKNKFSCFLNNTWLSSQKSSPDYILSSPTFDKKYADVYFATANEITEAHSSSLKAFEVWKDIPLKEKSECLLRIAQNVKKHHLLFSLAESLVSKNQLLQAQKRDLSLSIQSMEYCANLVEEAEEWNATGVVCVLPSTPHRFLVYASWRIGSLLASGNVILLLVEARTCPSAFLFAKMCQLAGLPPGVLNILCVDYDNVIQVPYVRKVIGADWVAEGSLRASFSAEPFVVVYENADLHAAVDDILRAFQSSNLEKCFRVLVQESVAKNFNELIGKKISRIVLKKDTFSAEQKKGFEELIAKAKEQHEVLEGAQADVVYPIVVCHVPTTSKLLEKCRGPVLVTTLFRTVKESIEMLNWGRCIPTLSVWSETLTLALEVTHLVKARTVWINSHDSDLSIGEFRGDRAFYECLQLFDPHEPALLPGGGEQTGNERSDVQTAVAAAVTALSRWATLSRSQRCQALLRAADTFTDLQCSKRLRFWARYADRQCGTLKETSTCGQMWEEWSSVGVIAIMCPGDLLSLISLVAPAVAFGNAVVVGAETLECAQLLLSSGLPVSILKKSMDAYARLLEHHPDVDALWLNGPGTARRNFDFRGACKDLNPRTCTKLQLESTESKTVIVPTGTIFAN